MNIWLNLLMGFGSAGLGGYMLFMAFGTKRDEHGWRAYFYTMAFLNAVMSVHFFWK